MHIAVLAHLRHPIAPPFKGGMEAHCHGLVRALSGRGHNVTLFASGDSDRRLNLSPIIDSHYDAVLPWALWHGTPELDAFQASAFGRAWDAVATGAFDIVHNNTMNAALHCWAERDGVPMVTSLHVPPFEALADAVGRHAAPWLRQTVTSHAHRDTWWTQPPTSASVVHNGIDLEGWRFHAEGNGRAVWCGRITPTKGTAVALDAARAAGMPLDLVGPVDCQLYFDDEVAPRLASDCVYHGHLAGPALAMMIGAASVMLATPMWDEPFGLVVAEALACGVPVAALDRGAMREIVGDAGALAIRPEALPAAIIRALGVSRADCRARAEALFSINAMIDGYEDAYAAAIAGARASRIESTRALLA